MKRQRVVEHAVTTPGVTPEVTAEAAVWVARLHGPGRSSRMERECLQWQERSAAHRMAFERCTDTWQDVPRVSLVNAYAASSSNGSASGDPGRLWNARRSRWAFALVLAAVVVGGGAGVVQFWRGLDAYSTGVGEQQLVVLKDGTRMSLNTDTRVRVAFDSTGRSVNVEGGEALFEVAKDPQRPFVVRAARSEVLALGTVFSVRLAGEHSSAGELAVTLIEGQVTVRAVEGNAAQGVAPARPVLMQPGERMRLVKSANASGEGSTLQVDRPRIDQVIAWRRSEAVFDDVSLADAVAEMNRYNRTPIVLVGDKSLADLRVSGIYRTGDSAGFARAVAALHGLVVHEGLGRFELASTQ